MADGPPRTEQVEDIASLDRAIAGLESQRSLLGDDVAETALAPLRERRAALLLRHAGEQRKLVTVLFADLVDFTVLSRRLDAEDTRAVVGAYFSRWNDAITAQGGTVEKFIGDAVMAVFGLAQSWEDDAQRAIRAALAMTEGLAALNAELEASHGVQLQMRVGIDTGDVVVSTLEERAGHEFVAVGPTVNRASRIQSAAPPGRVLISGDTHRQVRGWFSVEPVRGLVLKGIDDPVDAYLVVSERPHGFRLDRAGGVEGVNTATVGRELELRTLQERLLDVIEDSQWCVVTMLGDAGVGKSRLLLDFDSWLEERPEPVWWFRGRASQSGSNRANALLHDLVASRFLIQDTDPPEVVRDKFGTGFAAAFDDDVRAGSAARLVAAWLGFDPQSSDGLPSDPQSLRDQASAALADYLAALSRTAPVVVLLEDLHWADDGSLRWVDTVDRFLHDRPVLVVATARPVLLEQRPRWGEGLAHHARVQLEPLSRRASRQLLSQILQRVDEPPAALVNLVIEAAEGNPFYIEELVTWLVEAGVIVKGDGAWQVVEQLLGDVAVPSTLRGVLQARLDSLTPGERGLLQRASVVGRVFWDEAVARLDGGAVPTAGSTAGPTAGPTPASEVLDGLRRRELVFEREVSAFESAREFLFKHALLRDVAYEGVLRAHRERYHRLTALWLADVSGRTGREREYAALIAQHFDSARSPEAAHWCLRAGRQAAAVFALEEATRLLGRGLELAPQTDPGLRFDLLAERETVLERIGDRSGQEVDLTEMDALTALLPDDEPRRLTLLLARARSSFEHSDYDRVLELTSQVAEAAERAGLPARAVEARLWRGKALTWNEDLDGARNCLAAARDLAHQLGRLWLEGEALRYLAMVANDSGDFPLALEMIALSRRAFAEDGDREAEAVAATMQATTAFHMGRIEEARVVFEEVLEVFRRSGHRYREAVVVGNIGSVAFAEGRLAEAALRSEEAAELTRQLADIEATANNLLVVADVDVAVGRWEAAHRILDEALELATSVSSARLAAGTFARGALLAIEEGDVTSAVELARKGVEEISATPSPMDRGHCHTALGYAELAQGDLDAAEAAFGQSREDHLLVDREPLVREAEVGIAAVALQRGDLARAVDLVRPVLGRVDPQGLQDCLRPASVLLTTWRVLDHAQDPEAETLLSRARAFILDRAEATGDPGMADGYLAKIAETQLLRESERRLGR